MNNIARKIFLVLLILLIAGCASSHVLVGVQRAAIDVKQVRIYTKPPTSYEEVAMLEASSRGAFALGDQSKMDAVIQRLKQEAASLGANGVVLQMIGSDGGGVGTGFTAGKTGLASGFFATPMIKSGQALAIYVASPD